MAQFNKPWRQILFSFHYITLISMSDLLLDLARGLMLRHQISIWGLQVRVLSCKTDQLANLINFVLRNSLWIIAALANQTSSVRLRVRRKAGCWNKATGSPTYFRQIFAKYICYILEKIAPFKNAYLDLLLTLLTTSDQIQFDLNLTTKNVLKIY